MVCLKQTIFEILAHKGLCAVSLFGVNGGEGDGDPLEEAISTLKSSLIGLNPLTLLLKAISGLQAFI